MSSPEITRLQMQIESLRQEIREGFAKIADTNRKHVYTTPELCERWGLGERETRMVLRRNGIQIVPGRTTRVPYDVVRQIDGMVGAAPKAGGVADGD
jgi:predicted phage tail protein